MSFRAFSARDLIALSVVSFSTLHDGAGTTTPDPQQLVAFGYAVADQFVQQSSSGWAIDERERKASKVK